MGICDAIRARALVRLNYDGYHRLVEPYVVGQSKKGKHLLRAYQVGGGSVSNEPVGWKLFDLAETVGVGETDSTFSVRREYNPNDPVMVAITCRV